MWEVDVVSPGGSVTATISAGPPGKFSVADVVCLDSRTMIHIPATVHGQSVVFTFDAVPDGASRYECYFTFDAALLPRPTPYPTSASVPRTNALGVPRAPESPQAVGLVSVVFVGLAAGLLTLIPRRYAH